LRRQQRSLLLGTLRPSTYVVVAIDDPGVDGSLDARLEPEVVHLPGNPQGLPLAAARNAGVAQATSAGADVVILLDVDCLAGRELVTAYRDAVGASPDVVWSGPVTYLPPAPPSGYDLTALDRMDAPHPGRPAPSPGDTVTGAPADLFWSLSFACDRHRWERTGGFCEEYVGYGGEDTDFAHVVLERGLLLGWVGSARAYHQHHPVSDPPVEHLDDILRNARLFRHRWGWWPMSAWLSAFEKRGLIEPDGHSGWRRVQTAGVESAPTYAHAADTTMRR
jgi:GT2 family glycosyltransferase